MHKIPIFRDPDEEEEETCNENEMGESNQKKKRNSKQIYESTELEKYTPEFLEEINSSEITASLQKEEEYLKTLSPNLNTLQDYEKKVNL